MVDRFPPKLQNPLILIAQHINVPVPRDWVLLFKVRVGGSEDI